jgi:hypothetical protein
MTLRTTAVPHYRYTVEQPFLAVTPQTFIREVLGSALGQDPGYSELVVL